MGTHTAIPQCSVIIIITQTAAIALESLTTQPDEWAEPLNVVYVHNIHIEGAIAVCCSIGFSAVCIH